MWMLSFFINNISITFSFYLSYFNNCELKHLSSQKFLFLWDGVSIFFIAYKEYGKIKIRDKILRTSTTIIHYPSRPLTIYDPTPIFTVPFSQSFITYPSFQFTIHGSHYFISTIKEKNISIETLH